MQSGYNPLWHNGVVVNEEDSDFPERDPAGGYLFLLNIPGIGFT
jgi:hypothetical protein